MGRVSASIDAATEEFIREQKMFFVATAPLDPQGHVNLSPKGLDTFRILGPTTVGYLDLTGSGIETVAHLQENGRIVLMFCAFQGPPKIVRLHGRGRVVEPANIEFSGLQKRFPEFLGTRSIIVVQVERVSESCGFGVPLMRHQEERTQLQSWAQQRGAGGLEEYRRTKNGTSIDGLAGLASIGPTEGADHPMIPPNRRERD